MRAPPCSVEGSPDEHTNQMATIAGGGVQVRVWLDQRTHQCAYLRNQFGIGRMADKQRLCFQYAQGLRAHAGNSNARFAHRAIGNPDGDCCCRKGKITGSPGDLLEAPASALCQFWQRDLSDDVIIGEVSSWR